MHQYNKKGFGLVEVLLSGAIIVVILGALVIIARAAFNNDLYMQRKAQATYLAQAGIEIARSIRDSNWIDGRNDTSWKNFTLVANSEVTSAGCYKASVVNSNGTTRYSLVSVVAANKDACKLMAQNGDSVNSEVINELPLIPDYTDSAKPSDKEDGQAPPDTFYRLIYLEPLTATDLRLPTITGDSASNVYPDINALQVNVFVGFNFNGDNNLVEMSEVLTNWRPDF